uniref:Uncharacterized protein n=1 Tax=Triticum urartu TaxID=4572 RepID=A0A8R7QB15_TRIUA
MASSSGAAYWSVGHGRRRAAPRSSPLPYWENPWIIDRRRRGTREEEGHWIFPCSVPLLRPWKSNFLLIFEKFR